MTSKQIDQMIEAMLERLELKPVSSRKKEKLSQYVKLLLEGLKKTRLTGEKTAEGIIKNQIYDSLKILMFFDLNPGTKVVDLGSGGGLPGLPVKICKPDIEIYLMDANRKKALFLKEAITNLNINLAEVLCGRAEDYGQSAAHRARYDLIICKAVAKAAVLAELALPLVKVGGIVALYKGPLGAKEIQEAEKAIAVCGGQQENSWHYKLQNGEKRMLYLIRKIIVTPPKYPRRAGKPLNNPIN